MSISAMDDDNSTRRVDTGTDGDHDDVQQDFIREDTSHSGQNLLPFATSPGGRNAQLGLQDRSVSKERRTREAFRLAHALVESIAAQKAGIYEKDAVVRRSLSLVRRLRNYQLSDLLAFRSFHGSRQRHHDSQRNRPNRSEE